MDSVMLSGGDFGGESRDVPPDQEEIVLVNASGTWTYSRERHPDGSSTAHLVKFEIAKNG